MKKIEERREKKGEHKVKCIRAQTKNPKWNHCREITLCTLIVESSLLLFFSLSPSFYLCLHVGYRFSMDIDLAMYRHISEVCNEMSVNVIFSIVYCMHFIWYFIGAIARSLSEWICSLSRLSNREFDLKGFSCTFHWTEYFSIFLSFFIWFFFSRVSYSLFLYLSFILFPNESRWYIFRNRDHIWNYMLFFHFHSIGCIAICINTTQTKVNQAKPNQFNKYRQRRCFKEHYNWNNAKQLHIENEKLRGESNRDESNSFRSSSSYSLTQWAYWVCQVYCMFLPCLHR